MVGGRRMLPDRKTMRPSKKYDNITQGGCDYLDRSVFKEKNMTFEIEYVFSENDIYHVGFKCDIESYHILLKCSKNKDYTEWNNWRNANQKIEIYLQGADLCHFRPYCNDHPYSRFQAYHALFQPLD